MGMQRDKKFWKKWMEEINNIGIIDKALGLEDIVLGYTEKKNYEVINVVLIITKKYIHEQKMKEKRISFILYQMHLKKSIQLLGKVAEYNGEKEDFEKNFQYWLN